MSKKLILTMGLFVIPFYYFSFYPLKKYPGCYRLDLQPGELNFLITGKNL